MFILIVSIIFSLIFWIVLIDSKYLKFNKKISGLGVSSQLKLRKILLFNLKSEITVPKILFFLLIFYIITTIILVLIYLLILITNNQYLVDIMSSRSNFSIGFRLFSFISLIFLLFFLGLNTIVNFLDTYYKR